MYLLGQYGTSGDDHNTVMVALAAKAAFGDEPQRFAASAIRKEISDLKKRGWTPGARS